MTLDDQTQLLGRQLRGQKERLVATTTDGPADLNPSLFFFRGPTPVAGVQLHTDSANRTIMALTVGAGGFDAEVTAVCFDMWLQEEVVVDGASDISLSEVLQIYSVNRAGDLRWYQHGYHLEGSTVRWRDPYRLDTEFPPDAFAAQLQFVMEQPSMTHFATQLGMPNWMDQDETDPDVERWLQDMATAETIRDVTANQACIALYAVEGSRRSQIMQDYPLPGSPNPS
jgi:hypothetical protein